MILLEALANRSLCKESDLSLATELTAGFSAGSISQVFADTSS